MALQYSPFIPLLVLSAVVVITLSVVVLEYRSGVARIPFVSGMTGVTIWTLAYAIELANTGFAAKMLWHKISYIGIVIVPTTWLVFLVVYTDREHWLTWPRLAALGIEPAIVLGLVWSSHDLYERTPELVEVTYVSGFELVRIGPIKTLEFAYGPFFWVNLVYSYGLLLIGAIILVMFILDGREVYRRQAASLLVGMSFPWMTNAADITGLIPSTNVDLTPVSFTAMGTVFALALIRYQLFQIVPLARRTVIEELDAGVLVVDRDGKITKPNPAAEELLGMAEHELVDTPITEALPDAAPIERLLERGDSRRYQFTVDGPDTHRHLDVQVSRLDEDGHELGHLVVLRDITERELRQQRLEVLSRILRHNVRNDMNLVLGHANPLREAVSESKRKHADIIEDTASDLVSLSEKARTVERVLREEEEAPRAVDLGDRLERIIEEFRTEYPDATIDTQLSGALYANRTVEIAVREAIENALEHAGDDVIVEIVGRREGDTIEIVVRDDGPGIPPEERKALTRERETPLEHGSGLGLWLVTWIAHSVGGDVAFDSSDPGGSGVHLSIPAMSPPDDEIDEKHTGSARDEK